MSSRYLVAAVRAEYEQATILESTRETREDLEHRVVGPLEIVEDDRRRRERGEDVECEPHRFEECGHITLAWRRRAELGKQKCKLRCQLTDARTCLGPASEPVTQRCDNWSVRRRHPLDCEPPQDGN